MKILKEGDMALNWTKQVSCRKCKAELEVEEADVRWTHYCSDDHPVHYFVVDEIRCTCPMCGSTIKVCGSDELSPLMRDRLEKRGTTTT